MVGVGWVGHEIHRVEFMVQGGVAPVGHEIHRVGWVMVHGGVGLMKYTGWVGHGGVGWGGSQ